MTGRQLLRQALQTSQLSEIDKLLDQSPDLLVPKDKDGPSVLFDVAVRGHFESIQHLLGHKAYLVLSIPQKQQLLRDVIAGGIEHAKKIFNDENLREARDVIEDLLEFNKQIVSKSDRDSSRYHQLLSLSSHIDMMSGTEENRENAIRTLQFALSIAETIYRKTDDDYRSMIIYCNSVGRFYIEANQPVRAFSYYQKALDCCRAMSEQHPEKPSLTAKQEALLARTHHGMLLEEAQLWGMEASAAEAKPSPLRSVLLETQYPAAQYPDRSALLKSIRDILSNQARESAAYFTDQLGGVEFFQHVAPLVKSKLWTTQHLLEVLALSRALNVNLVILRADGDMPIILKQSQAQATVYLGMEPGEQYCLLQKTPENVPQRDIRLYFDLAPVDPFSIRTRAAKRQREEDSVDSATQSPRLKQGRFFSEALVVQLKESFQAKRSTPVPAPAPGGIKNGC